MDIRKMHTREGEAQERKRDLSEVWVVSRRQLPTEIQEKKKFWEES